MMATHSIPSNILETIDETNLLKVKSVVSSESKKQYKIISYKKEMLSTETISTHGKYRSVIINDAGAVVAFAPPKSVNATTFMESHPVDENIIAEEFVEGTMLNLFYNDGAWEVATKQTIGANTRFYTNTSDTFFTMFMDAMSQAGLVFSSFDKKYCYSFVLQHPKNRIVVAFEKPALYLIALYEITFAEETKTYDIVKVNVLPKMGFYLKNAKRYDDGWETYSNLSQKYASPSTPYECVGVMIHDRVTGERCKIRNPTYEHVRKLRGNQPKLQYHYLCLRKEGNVAEYLRYYPEHRQAFSNYRTQMHLLTHYIFQNYIQCYMKKEKPLIEFPSQYKPHMFNLHKLYVDVLKQQQQYVTKAVVIEYMNNLHPSQQLYWLNYNRTG
jgi:hypothetical protein